MKKTTTKTIATFLLVLGLFSTMVFADGGSPTGSKNCGFEGQPPCPPPTPLPEPQNEDPILSTVKEYLMLIFG